VNDALTEQRSLRRAAVALAATLAIQVYTSLAQSAPSVLAPVIAPALGWSPNLVGVFVGLTYAGSMLGSLLCAVPIARFGPIRVSQLAVLLCVVGVALVAAASLPAAWALVAIAPIVIGLGYGPITPASSQVLARTAPPSRMALTFSIKQTGVPAGAALAGALLPALALAVDWRTALACVALLGLVVALAAQPLRADLDAGERAAKATSLAEPFAPLKDVFADPRLRQLANLSFFYAATQVSLTSFLIVYLTQAQQWSLVGAGFALTVATLAGVAGRVAWGAVADRMRAPYTVLGALGVAAGACALGMAAWPPGAPLWLLYALCAVFGATAIGWNGVQLAEVARSAPQGRAGAITGATGFVTFGGVVCGPTLFSIITAITGSYRSGFVAIGVGSLACGALTLWRRTGR
jgi:predicted MFS family arabinose efflux permease